ncbi:hypothetical protein K488DRAFT_84462 [Vararia minispora EC-137]|uniref:Uncharacterized protein n=1 Tax=Vararia minispora EC-137 TaxID=1314806 RepID=A0ACB8QQ48_9AGAM|nr:hypothetical protein K488DRAFT_84462 [Vararia minispora EC-137]
MPPPPGPPKKLAKAKGDSASSPHTPSSAKPASRAGKRSSATSLAEIKASPLTANKAPPIQRFQTPDDRDETGSVAESTASKAQRKTEEERIQWFHGQADCQEVEPHRAFCGSCKEWIALNPTLTYTMRPWIQHRKSCRRGSNQKPSSIATSPKSPGCEDGTSDADESASALLSSVGKAVRRSEAERQEILEQDPRAEEVRPYEVLCKTCSRWVKLGNKRRYNLEPWKKHQKSCSGQIPSSRVATAERKMKLVNDNLVKSFTTRSIECVHCNETIGLEGEGDYDLKNWETHKVLCSGENAHTAGAGNSGSSEGTHPEFAAPSQSDGEIAVPRLQVRELAAADESAMALGSSRGTKRAREDDVVEMRPAVRRRTLSYQSTALSWILTPLKSFIAGFRAGMSLGEDQPLEAEGPSPVA